MTQLGTEDRPLLVAVVGSGPSGFYAAEALFKSDLIVKVDMLERLPNPYGLVRSGVAPDHPKLKQAIQVYAKIAESPNFNFIGNVTVGRDIAVDELRATHHAIIFTCGAESDRKLGIPGEDLPGSYTATEFVGWYNGHVDYRDRKFDFSHETAVIIGQGNVAADVSRILAKTPDELKHTDIAEHALQALAQSRIKNIYVIGRRGPAQAKFTSKELKEFSELDACAPFVETAELTLNSASEEELADKTNTAHKKNIELFQHFASGADTDKQRRCHFTFLKSPATINGSNRVESITLENNRLAGEPFQQSARGTGETFNLETGIVFRSIGYRGIPIAGVPFDDESGVFPNTDGRITNQNDNPIPQFYTAGWIKRGPTGIIGTNRACSVATVKSLLKDVELLESDDEKTGTAGLYRLLTDRDTHPISFADWKKIDQQEVERGQACSKPREKFTSVAEMLQVLV